MTRKHFIELVDIIVDNRLDEGAIQDIMRFCKRHNSRFDKATFYHAIESKLAMLDEGNVTNAN
tara:strand:- start:97 stop:285 length:189 start_codon:yes stop_codon:yes gene_type:complete